MKYKIRFVACRNEQQHGLDFQETFVPIAKWSTICYFVSLAMGDLHMDVKSTFFNGYIKEDVYAKHHCGFIIRDLEDKYVN
jgi:hypothetical protein